MRWCGLLAALALVWTGAPASAGAPGGLAVWPARIRLPAGLAAQVHVANRTNRAAAIGVRIAGLALDLRGAPHVVGDSPGSPLLAAAPRRLVVAPGHVATLTVRARRAGGAGDRPALVLVTARSGAGAGVGVRVRFGVAVEVRLPGAVMHRLALGALRVRGRTLELAVRNRGNVEERIVRGVLLAQVWRRGRLLAAVDPRAQDVLPHARALLRLRAPVGIRGRVRVVVVAPRLGAAGRSYAVTF